MSDTKMWYNLRNPPAVGTKVYLFFEGPFTVKDSIDGYLTFTDRRDGWWLDNTENSSHCFSYTTSPIVVSPEYEGLYE